MTRRVVGYVHPERLLEMRLAFDEDPVNVITGERICLRTGEVYVVEEANERGSAEVEVR